MVLAVIVVRANLALPDGSRGARISSSARTSSESG
jgi:hypothetical protein